MAAVKHYNECLPARNAVYLDYIINVHWRVLANKYFWRSKSLQLGWLRSYQGTGAYLVPDYIYIIYMHYIRCVQHKCSLSMLQFRPAYISTLALDSIGGLKHFSMLYYFPLHSPLLRESWLVSIVALRWLICLSLARILARADVS